MNDIERSGANAVNTLDSQAAITGGSFSVRIGKTRFIVRVVTSEKSEAERPSVLADLKSKSEHIPPAKRSEGYEEVL